MNSEQNINCPPENKTGDLESMFQVFNEQLKHKDGTYALVATVKNKKIVWEMANITAVVTRDPSVSATNYILQKHRQGKPQ